MTTDQSTSAGIRIGSMLLDHFVMTFVSMLFFIPDLISMFSTAFEITHKQQSLGFPGGISYIGLMGFAIYFCKDCIKGRSIAKRILKLQVVENKTGKTASPIRCYVRNIFCIIWPLEFFVVLASPGRRIGDLVAGTKVIPYSPANEQPKINYAQTGISLLLAYGLSIIMILPFERMVKNFESKPATCIESSLNKQAALEIEKLFNDSLGDYLSPDVQVYDRIKECEGLKYVSVILQISRGIICRSYKIRVSATRNHASKNLDS